MIYCAYGCEKEAKFQPAKGRKKVCCSESPNTCPAVREKRSKLLKGRIVWNKDIKTGPQSEKQKSNISKAIKLWYEDLNNKEKILKRNRKISSRKRLNLNFVKEYIKERGYELISSAILEHMKIFN